MRRFLLTLDKIDILCLVKLHLNKLSIKYQSYPNSTKIDAFEQIIYMCHNPNENKLKTTPTENTSDL